MKKLSAKHKSYLYLALYALFMIATAIIFSKYVNQDSLQSWIEGTGTLGIILYFIIEVVYVIFTPLFNTFILIASGYIFGGHLGFIINFLATTVGLFLIVLLVKKYGRPILKKVLSEHFYNRFDKLVEKIGPITLLIIYVLPFTPDDEFTYIIAAGPIPLKRLVLPILLGNITKAAYSYIGAMGQSGIKTALYVRIFILIIGLVLVGTQEYYYSKKSRIKA